MSKLQQQTTKLFQSIIERGLIVILLLMPFHAFFSIYLGSLGVSQGLVQSWKEVLILVLMLCWGGLSILRHKLQMRLDLINILFLIIIALSAIVTVVSHPSIEATLFGIKTNIVALVIFFIAQLPIASGAWIRRHLVWLVICPGVAVAIIAILQSMLLSDAFIASLGYNTSNINPRQIVDGSLPFFRAFSTLGGPNQLGTYLILPLVFSIVVGLKQKKYWMLGLTLTILAGILLSFSRSAWLGAVIAIFTASILLASTKWKIIISSAVAFLLVIMIALLPVLIANNPRLENVLFHGRVFENQIEGSDQSRLEAISTATKNIGSQPLGHGLGSAGPASFRATHPVIPENWFLQIAYEIGVVGLALYIVAFACMLGEFLRDRQDIIAIGLFATTSAILVANLFLHAWADSTLALVMFTLYGLYRGQDR